MRDDGPQIVVALRKDRDEEVSIEEACAIEGKRPAYRCPECDNELIAHCRKEKASSFVHRLPGTSCLGRRIALHPPTHSGPAVPTEPAPGWAPPVDPAELAAARAAFEAERQRLLAPPAPPSPPQPPVTPWPAAWQSPPPRPSAPAQPAPDYVEGPEVNFLDLYFPGRRVLQLIALFVPHRHGPGGRLALHVRDPARDTHGLEGYPIKDWSASVTRQELRAALDEAARELREGLGATEAAVHQRFVRAPSSEPRRIIIPPPRRDPPWTQL